MMFKVITDPDRHSAAMVADSFMVSYPPQEWVIARKDTIGLLCFRSKDAAVQFISVNSRRRLMIIEVMVLESDILPTPQHLCGKLGQPGKINAYQFWASRPGSPLFSPMTPRGDHFDRLCLVPTPWQTVCVRKLYTLE